MKDITLDDLIDIFTTIKKNNPENGKKEVFVHGFDGISDPLIKISTMCNAIYLSGENTENAYGETTMWQNGTSIVKNS